MTEAAVTVGDTTPDPEIVEAFRTILRRLNQSGEVLRDSPRRAAKALSFLTSGYRTTLSEAAGTALFSVDERPSSGISPTRAPTAASSLNLVVVKGIRVHSLCEHHLLPFVGMAHVGYLPDQQVLGLSKLGRICDMFARRLQMQERLTSQIGEALTEAASPQGVAVVLSCSHMCMCARGVRKDQATTTTSFMGGAFATNRDLRDEFWRHVSLDARGPPLCEPCDDYDQQLQPVPDHLRARL